MKKNVKLIVLRGLPGSGKTTAAREWVSQDPDHRARVGRDALRDALYGTRKGLSGAQEDSVTRVQREAVRALLRASRDVIVDDMNLRARYARAWADLALEEGVGFEVIDARTPVEECIKRDANRPEGEQVGADVIRGLNKRFHSRPAITPTKKKEEPQPLPYAGTEGKPKAVIVDVDGTLAKNAHGRSFYSVGADLLDDEAVEAVCEVVRSMSLNGYTVLVVSGRSDEAEIHTADWLSAHVGSSFWDELFLRKAGDNRPDSIVKAEIFDTYIRDNYDVIAVIDDRDSVCRMWRAMGLICFQAAPGAF